MSIEYCLICILENKGFYCSFLMRYNLTQTGAVALSNQSVEQWVSLKGA